MIATVLGLPFRVASTLRSARAFHSDGVQFDGALVRLLAEESGLPLRSCAVSVRVSKGIGVPSGLPDVAGLSLRLPPTEQGGSPWDLLLAGSATGRIVRMVPWPSASWNSAHLSSLMALKYRGDMWWLRARITSPAIEGMSIDDIRTAVAHDKVSFVIEHACESGAFAGRGGALDRSRTARGRNRRVRSGTQQSHRGAAATGMAAGIATVGLPTQSHRPGRRRRALTFESVSATGRLPTTQAVAPSISSVRGKHRSTVTATVFRPQ